METMQSIIVSGVCGLMQKYPPQNNSIRAYLPYRHKEAQFNFDYVAGVLVGTYFGIELSGKFDIEELRRKSLKAINAKAANDRLEKCLDDLYFSDEASNLKELSPLFKILYISREGGKISEASRRLGKITGRFIASAKREDSSEKQYNIFERIIAENLWSELIDRSVEDDDENKEPEPYLPFVAEQFAGDFNFLIDHPKYFINQVRNFLNLYLFLYCSQTALSLKDWENGPPSVKPLYFILDTEKCSLERKAAKSYRDLLRSVGDVFPFLSMLDVLNEEISKAGGCPVPLWKIYQCLTVASPAEQESLCAAFDTYIERFIAEEKPGRNLKFREPNESRDLRGKLKLLFQYAIDQFDLQRLYVADTRYQMKEKYKARYEKEVALHFAQSRGRLGKILVMNKDYLLLLTNLVIAGRESVRLQEVMEGFRNRGFFFDKQSELELISFFERVGNVERMSDSGDAIYVRPTV